MGPRLWTVFMLAIGAGTIAACAKDEPAPGPHTLTGHVALTGFLVDAGGNFAGTRVVHDAGGVPVELRYGSQTMARTTTVHGDYRFDGVAPGGYVVRAQVLGGVHDQTRPVTVGDTDLFAGDTLNLVSIGDLYPVPNPIGDECFVYFDLPDTEQVDVRVRDLGGNTVRTLLQARRPPGVNQVRWDGLDANGQPATAALYWVTLEAVDGVRVQLLFR